jgi:NitT/TauT family transport system substrate-binding protein
MTRTTQTDTTQDSRCADGKACEASEPSLSRRALIRAGAAAGALGSAAWFSGRAGAQPRQKITFAWSQASFCHSPIPVALERGFFERTGLIHRWIKPLGAGLDVKLIGSVHGGCLRLVGLKSAGVTLDPGTLKGKTIGVADLNSPAKQFYSIHLAKRGLDMDKDIEWRVYPADLLDVAAKKGEIQAIADGDPNLYLIEKRNPGTFLELGNSAKNEYAESICCVIGAGAKFAKANKPAAASVVRALTQASDYIAENPNETAKIFARYSPKVPVEDLQRLLAELTFKHHPHGKPLRDEVQAFAADFRTAGVLKKQTDPGRFASHITLDVLA